MQQDDTLVPDRFIRASDFNDKLGEANNPEWKTVAYDETSGNIVVPNGTVGFRWGETGKWNLEEKDAAGKATKLRLSLGRYQGRTRRCRLPLLRQSRPRALRLNQSRQHSEAPHSRKEAQLADGETLVASVHDLFLANYGVDCGYGGANVASIP